VKPSFRLFGRLSELLAGEPTGSLDEGMRDEIMARSPRNRSTALALAVWLCPAA
jgi:hypothetical protein